MKALVTGANGLIGSNLIKELLNQDFTVKAFVRETSNLKSLYDLDIELAYGDILDYNSLLKAMQGCQIVFHTAAVYAYWGFSDDQLKSIAVEGTKNVINAAHKANIKKVILTSSSAILGSNNNRLLLNEKSSIDITEYLSPYIKAKIEQENVGFKLANKLRIELVAVLPTITIGSPDYKLSESNSIIVRYLNDPFKASWIGGCNIVSVKDVAKGHIIAAKKGINGERYILGSENLEWKDVHRMISSLCGLPGPLMIANHTSAYIAAATYEIISLINRKPPVSTRVQAKMVGRFFWYDHSRISKLGYNPRSAHHALVEAISWLISSSHISNSLRATMHLSDEIYNFRKSKGS